MIHTINTTVHTNELAKACAPWINAADPTITADEITNERWRQIPSLPDYEASTLGRIRRIGGEFVPQGYRGTTTLYPGVSIKSRYHYTHRLVAEAFYGPAARGWEVDHIDGNSFNNRAGNLDYVTRSENVRRARQRAVKKRLGRAPWMAIYDAALLGQTITLQPGGCNRGHTAEEFGTRKDGVCRACKSAAINIQHDITRELMSSWYDGWRAVMAGVTPQLPEPDEDDICDVVDIADYQLQKVA